MSDAAHGVSRRGRGRRLAIRLVAGAGVLAAPLAMTVAAASPALAQTACRVPQGSGGAPSHRIAQIQGAAFFSPLVAQPPQATGQKTGSAVANVPGVITQLASNGFYVQDAAPTGTPAGASNGIFVFTSSAPASDLCVGAAVEVTGVASEFRAGGSGGAGNLAVTQIQGTTPSPLAVRVLSNSNLLPAPVVIGTGLGEVVPALTDISTSAGSALNVETSAAGVPYVPGTDGLSFWESLESMRVTIANPVAIGPVARFSCTGSGANSELPVIADGLGVTRTPRGGVLYSGYGDPHPERMILKRAGCDPATSIADANVGAKLADATGVIGYDFSYWKLIMPAAPVVAVPSPITKTVVPASTQLSIATFNVENLAATDQVSKFDGLANVIVNNMRSPDILSLEEIQDNNGTTDNGTVSASTTYATLIAAITAAGGPTYAFRQIDPVNNADGGAPGGNIRVAILFRTDRAGLSFVDIPGGTSTSATSVLPGPTISASPGRIDPGNAAWNASRKPLVGQFTWNGAPLFVIANHFISKGGDQSLAGLFQQPQRSSEVQRLQQATLVNAFVSQILAVDPNAKVVVLGDINDFEFSPVTTQLEAGGALTSLMKTLPVPERYSYVFTGNSQTLDQILVSPALAARLATYLPVHVNSEFFDQVSDHDPQLARFADVPAPVVPEAGATVLLPLLGGLVLAVWWAGHRSRRPAMA